MNKTLIVYDLEGNIIDIKTGNYKIPVGLPYLEVVIPDGQFVKSIDVENKTPIYECFPKSEIEIMKEKIQELENALEKTNMITLASSLKMLDLKIKNKISGGM